MSETITEPAAPIAEATSYAEATARYTTAPVEAVRSEELPSEAAAREFGLLPADVEAQTEVPAGFWEEIERQTEARAETMIEERLAPIAEQYGLEPWQLRLILEAADDPENFQTKWGPEVAREAARVELEQRAEAAKQYEQGDTLARDLLAEFEGELGEIGEHDDVLARAEQLFPSMMERAAELRRLYPDNPAFADGQMVAAACVRVAAEAAAAERKGTQRIDAELDHLEKQFGRRLNSRERVTVVTLAETVLPKFGDDWPAVRQALHAVVRDELGEPRFDSMARGMSRVTENRARAMRLERESAPAQARDDRKTPGSFAAAMRPFHRAQAAKRQGGR